MPEPPITDADMTSGPPSGETEPGTPGRRRLVMLLSAIGLALAVIVIAVALVASSIDSTDDVPQETPSVNTVNPTQPPATNLEKSPQSSKLGASGG